MKQKDIKKAIGSFIQNDPTNPIHIWIFSWNYLHQIFDNINPNLKDLKECQDCMKEIKETYLSLIKIEDSMRKCRKTRRQKSLL